MDITRVYVHSNIVQQMNIPILVRSSQDVGQLIAAARRRRGLSQREVAEALGVTQAWISRVERGQQKAWIGQVLRLAGFLNVRLTGSIVDTSSTSTEAEKQVYPDLDDLLKGE